MKDILLHISVFFGKFIIIFTPNTDLETLKRSPNLQGLAWYEQSYSFFSLKNANSSLDRKFSV